MTVQVPAPVSETADPDTVHTAGVSVRGRVRLDEDAVPEQHYEDHIVDWPLRVPRRARVPK